MIIHGIVAMEPCAINMGTRQVLTLAFSYLPKVLLFNNLIERNPRSGAGLNENFLVANQECDMKAAWLQHTDIGI